ncbi:MAG TPA: protein-glutamate O-methyltransferase CheR [Vicinamibacteria bacterium]|nr:protein-glutamate O-methyltransferase CheR [Vicinamibacteria bacterium]
MTHRPTAELELFRSLLVSRSGIDFGRHREAFLEARLRRRMTVSGARSLYEYYRMVTAPGSGGELQALVDEVSIHETSFFRNPPQFDLLRDLVLPERVSARLRASDRVLRLWSAGCSTGQEPYSMAMTLGETMVLSTTWDVRLLATDISAQALKQAARGSYTAQQTDGLSPDRLRRFFEHRSGQHTVRDWVRRGVEFLQGNLLEEPPGRDMDAVFCRNVMIYFDRESQKRLITRLTRALAPGGYLFLGHTETLAGLSDAFRMVSQDRGIAYQRLS